MAEKQPDIGKMLRKEGFSDQDIATARLIQDRGKERQEIFNIKNIAYALLPIKAPPLLTSAEDPHGITEKLNKFAEKHGLDVYKAAPITVPEPVKAKAGHAPVDPKKLADTYAMEHGKPSISGGQHVGGESHGSHAAPVAGKSTGNATHR